MSEHSKSNSDTNKTNNNTSNNNNGTQATNQAAGNRDLQPIVQHDSLDRPPRVQAPRPDYDTISETTLIIEYYPIRGVNNNDNGEGGGGGGGLNAAFIGGGDGQAAAAHIESVEERVTTMQCPPGFRLATAFDALSHERAIAIIESLGGHDIGPWLIPDGSNWPEDEPDELVGHNLAGIHLPSTTSMNNCHNSSNNNNNNSNNGNACRNVNSNTSINNSASNANVSNCTSNSNTHINNSCNNNSNHSNHNNNNSSSNNTNLHAQQTGNNNSWGNRNRRNRRIRRRRRPRRFCNAQRYVDEFFEPDGAGMHRRRRAPPRPSYRDHQEDQLRGCRHCSLAHSDIRRTMLLIRGYIRCSIDVFDSLRMLINDQVIMSRRMRDRLGEMD